MNSLLRLRSPRSLVTKFWIVLAAATIPGLVVALILGITLTTVVRHAEHDFESALSTAEHLAHIRLALEKEYSLVVRLPAELDQSRIEETARKLASVSVQIDDEIAHLASDDLAHGAASETAHHSASAHLAAPETVTELLAVHKQMKETAAQIVEAAEAFAQTTALELATGPYEEQSLTMAALLDAVGSNVDDVAMTSRAHLRRSARIASILTPLGIAGALILVAFGGWMMRRQLLSPLLRLTDHVWRIRRGGLAEINDDTGISSRSDEIGKLASEFNDLMRELEAARRQLIANSEAEVQKQVDLLETALTHMSQGLSMFDADGRLIVANKQYAEVYGIAPGVIRPGMTLQEIRALRVAAGSYYGDADFYVESAKGLTGEIQPSDTIIEHCNGRVISEVRRPRAGGGWVTTHEDVTERKRVEDRIAHMARHDALTNLPNRTLLRENLTQALKRTSRGECVTVLCLDLDRFKEVNDTFGHPIGDALLRSVTGRLVGCVREIDTVSRLSGDEFAIVHAGPKKDVNAGALAQRVIECMERPYEIDGHHVMIGVSVGVAVAPQDGRTPDELLKKADLALYRAKTDGRGVVRFFEPEMDTRVRLRRRLQQDLCRAVVAREFELLYQPMVNLQSEEVTGFEALLRWNHPELGTISPNEFISVAEDLGVMVRLGEWVLRQACRQAATWPRNVRVAVNISAMQFRSSGLVAVIKRALDRAGISPHQLEIEITESVLLRNTEAILATLHELRKLGVRVSLDDFGTGYSSMSYLVTFPFDKIKIDQSFIHDLSNREDCAAIVRAVTSLGQILHMTTTAEGVETADELEQVKAAGCTEAQGFFFGGPVPADKVETLIKVGRRNAAA
jgi:diguanylate cyclase (GGDEF)-like protein